MRNIWDWYAIFQKPTRDAEFLFLVPNLYLFVIVEQIGVRKIRLEFK